MYYRAAVPLAQFKFWHERVCKYDSCTWILRQHINGLLVAWAQLYFENSILCEGERLVGCEDEENTQIETFRRSFLTRYLMIVHVQIE